MHELFYSAQACVCNRFVPLTLPKITSLSNAELETVNLCMAKLQFLLKTFLYKLSRGSCLGIFIPSKKKKFFSNVKEFRNWVLVHYHLVTNDNVDR